ncbi:MAG: SUMF1/EgtB/PvdO family nonheme iron enzyme [Verrucomicrobiota bacterium]
MMMTFLRAYSAKRVLRGGSWANDARNCRSAYRNANEPGNRNQNMGLRLVAAHPRNVADPALEPRLGDRARVKCPGVVVGLLDGGFEASPGRAFFARKGGAR